VEMTHLFWNAILTLIVAPIIISIRKNETEAKRIDILLNKTREELGREYITKQEAKGDMVMLMERLEKLHEKVDKLFEVK